VLGGAEGKRWGSVLAAQPWLRAEPVYGSERRAVGSDLPTHPSAWYCQPNNMPCPLGSPNTLLRIKSQDLRRMTPVKSLLVLA